MALPASLRGGARVFARAVRELPQRMVKVGVALTGLVILAWALLMAFVDPGSDPQSPLVYVFLTVYAIAALLLIWGVLLVAPLIWRFIKGNSGLS
jgi:hypothetical protein